MRLLTKNYYHQSLEWQNGFEGWTGGEADSDPDDGWLIGGSGVQDWDRWGTPSIVSDRTGAKSLNNININNFDENLYRAITAGKQFLVEAYFLWQDNPDTNHALSCIQLDDGADSDDTLIVDVWGAEVSNPANAIMLEFFTEIESVPLKYPRLRLYSVFNNSAFTLEKSIDLGANFAADYTDRVTGIRLQVTPEGYIIWMDDADTGNWVLLAQDTWSNTNTMGNLDIFRWYAEYGTGRETAFDDITVYRLQTIAAAEIICAEIPTCSKRINGGGALVTLVDDFEYASYNTNKEFIWVPVEVWTDNLGRILWEGYIVDVITDFKQVILIGIEGIGTLFEIEAAYNGILAEGEVTAVGANYIDDSKAAFTDDLLTKFAVFTDVAGPSTETIYPGAGSLWQKVADGNTVTPSAEFYTRIEAGDDDEVTYWYARHTPEQIYCYLEFTVPNEDNSTALDFYLSLSFSASINYTQHGNGVDPQLWIYDDNGTAWEKIQDIEWDPETGTRVTLNLTQANLDGAISNYFDGSHVLKMRIHSGTPTDFGGTPYDYSILVKEVYVKNTYSTLFAAQGEKYEIDVTTGTRLTFTGQTPQSDGVGQADRYKVGDYLHNILTEIWNITDLTLDVDTTTIVDAADFTSAYIGDVLNNYVKYMDRYYWHKYGWTVQCKSSYIDSGINLTENDIDNYHLPGAWSFSRSGRNMINKIRILGSGVAVVETTSPSYQTPLNRVVTDNRISTDAMATSAASSILARDDAPAEHLNCKLDCGVNAENYTTLDIGTTLDVNLGSGSGPQITAGLLIELDYIQPAGTHLMAEIVVKVI